MKKKTFKEHFDSLSKEKRVEIRDRFLEATGLSYPSWYTKIYNNSFSKLEMKELSKICGCEFSAD